MAKQANKPLKTARRSAPPPLASAFRSVVTHASMAPGGARLLSLQQHWRLASMAMSRPTPPEFASWVVAREAAYGHKTNAPPPPRRPRPPPQHKHIPRSPQHRHITRHTPTHGASRMCGSTAPPSSPYPHLLISPSSSSKRNARDQVRVVLPHQRVALGHPASRRHARRRWGSEQDQRCCCQLAPTLTHSLGPWQERMGVHTAPSAPLPTTTRPYHSDATGEG